MTLENETGASVLKLDSKYNLHLHINDAPRHIIYFPGHGLVVIILNQQGEVLQPGGTGDRKCTPTKRDPDCLVTHVKGNNRPLV